MAMNPGVAALLLVALAGHAAGYRELLAVPAQESPISETDGWMEGR
jgi:hypothetical protein